MQEIDQHCLEQQPSHGWDLNPHLFQISRICNLVSRPHVGGDNDQHPHTYIGTGTGTRRAQLKISARTLRDCRSEKSLAQPELCRSVNHGKICVGRQTRRGARLCVPIARWATTVAQTRMASTRFHVACVRAHGWHVAGAGEVAQGYGKRSRGYREE